MKKILFIVTQSELGGAQKNVLDLAVELKNRYKVLVAAGPDGGGKLFKHLSDNKVRWHELKWLRRRANPIIDILGLIEIFSLLIKENPGIIHLHSSKAGFLGSLAGKLAGAKVVYTVHGAVFEAAFSKPARTLFLWLEKLAALFKDRVICVSQNDKKLWLNYRAAPEKKLFVVHNGLRLDQLEFLERTEAREYLAGQSAGILEALRGTDANLKIVGSIANFFPEKGLPFLVEAADTLLNKKRLPSVIFVVIGNGPEKKLLEKIVAAHGLQNKFLLVGNVSHAARYLKALDVFVLPSIKEGLPYTILEAMAAGVPIVASHVGGIPEMVKNNESAFLLFPRDIDGLAKKILELLDNQALAKKLTEAAKQKVQEFSLAKMIAETEKVYLD